MLQNLSSAAVVIYALRVNCVFVTFPCGILGQVWYLIVLIPDLCQLSYFGGLFWKRSCKRI